MYLVRIPDWMFLDSAQTLESFPIKQDALMYAQENLGADAKGFIQTVFAETKQGPTQVRVILHHESQPYMLKASSGLQYFPWAEFQEDLDFTLRDSANRLLPSLVKGPHYAKFLLEGPVVGNSKVFSARVNPDQMVSMGFGTELIKLSRKDIKNLSREDLDYVKSLGLN